MWTCSGLKRRAKAVLARTYWNSLVAVIIGFTVFLGIALVLSVIGAVLAVYKFICYSMLPFILCDNPKICFRRALGLSVAMTRGHAGRIFLLGLSFAGWVLLGLLALGIGVLFVIPYIAATFAELYARLRDNALKGGECAYGELNFSEPSGGASAAG